jgi:hypothetical protein
VQRYEMDCGKPSPSIPYGSEAIGFHIARRALKRSQTQAARDARGRVSGLGTGTPALCRYPSFRPDHCALVRTTVTVARGGRAPDTRAARCLPPSPLAGRPSPRRPGRFPSGPCGSSRSPRSDATVRAALPWRRPAATKPRQSPEKW